MAQYPQLSNAQQQQNSTLLDPFYCSEENFEEVNENYTSEQEDESFCCENKHDNNHFPTLLEQDLIWDDEELYSLFSKEERNELHEELLKNPRLAIAWSEAVQWMLMVAAHYSFSALTAVLAVNYLDRFLFCFHLQVDKPWMTQLAAVACLSLAAKVEETQVPLLLDLQVEESKYLFESKTIQKMEILVLSTLKWKMNPVTPLSFLDYITRRLGLKGPLCWEFLRRCERILLSIISDRRLMGYLPSVIATATMQQVVNCIEPSLGVEYKNQLLGILGIDKDKVDECTKLIMELEGGHYGLNLSKKRKHTSVPGSPNGVMDLTFSSDSSNDSWSVSSSSQPLTKKSRGQEDQQLVRRLKHATSDVLSIGR